MGYTKTNWIDRLVQYPNRYTRTNDGTYDTLIPAPGTINQPGTPITAAALNNLETQYDQSYADSKAYADGIANNPYAWIASSTQFNITTANALQVIGFSAQPDTVMNVMTLDAPNSTNIVCNEIGTYCIDVAMDISGLGAGQTFELIIRAYKDGGGTVYNDYNKLFKAYINSSNPLNTDTIPNRNMALCKMTSASGYFQILVRCSEAPRAVLNYQVRVYKVST